VPDRSRSGDAQHGRSGRGRRFGDADLPTKRQGTALAAYIALLLTYGLANALQDGWNEQLVKRGTVDSALPSMIRPDLSWAWAGILLGAVAIYFLLFRVDRVDRPEGGM